jgi:LuxR family maltose regulon positive regulatory protein
VEELNKGLARKLTIVTAPAGYGKTTLVAEWVHGLTRATTWVSLDKGENDPLQFFSYLIGAFQLLDREIGKNVVNALQSARPPEFQSLLAALVSDISTFNEPFVLILDDYHLIRETKIHDLLVSLLEHLHPQMHLVIVTRRDPPLPLPRMRVKGEMLEIRAKELQFSTEEAQEFLNDVMNLDLAANEIETLASRTEGWIAGLLLSAHSLKYEVDRKDFIRAFAGDDRYVMDYLIDEVLNRLPEESKEFLIKTSILDRMDASLCQELVFEGGSKQRSQDILEWLEKENLFTIPLDNRREWYRYHHLFADLLRYRLKMQRANELVDLHRRASEWYEGQGFVSDAIGHAQLGKAQGRVIELIEAYSLLEISRGNLNVVKLWLKNLPDENIQSRPYLGVLVAWTLLLTHFSDPPSEVGERLSRAEGLLTSGPKPSSDEERAQNEEIMVQISTARSLLAFFQGKDPKTVIRLSSLALTQLDKDEAFFRSILLLTLALSFLAMGDPDSADIHWIEARRLAQSCDLQYVIASSYYFQAMVAIRRARLTEAEAISKEALQRLPGQSELQYPVDGSHYLLLGKIAFERGDLEKAEHYLSQGEDLLRLTGETESLAHISGELARTHRAKGAWASSFEVIDQIKADAPLDIAYVSALKALHSLRLGEHAPEELKPALEWLGSISDELDAELEIPVGIPQYEMQYTILIIQARVGIGKARMIGSPRREQLIQPILRFLDGQTRLATDKGWSDRVIELATLRANALEALKDSKGALVSLKLALSLGEPEGYVRIFVDEGATIGKLLHQVVSGGEMIDYVGRILAKYPETKPSSSAIPKGGGDEVDRVEPLTERELEVLSLIAEGLSNKEIGQRLFLSLNTIKGHSRNIYGKLRVANRVQAASKARLMGLLPPN